METIDWKHLQATLTEDERVRLEQFLLTEGERFNIFPLSAAQEQVWFSAQRASGTATHPMHHIAIALRLEGRIHPDALLDSFNALIDRHEILRTTFHQIGSQPMQAIAPIGSMQITLPAVDLQGIAVSEQEREVERLAIVERERPFDAEQGPLLRIRLVVLAPAMSVLLLTIHHLVFDGWSMHILLRDLTALYTAAETGQVAKLLPLPIQYADFAVWQRRTVQTLTRQQAFLSWRQHLAKAAPLLDLPLKGVPSPLRTFRGSTHPITFPADLVKGLKLIAQGERATLFMVVLATFQMLLYRYTGQHAFVIGTYVANRQLPELADLIGDCTNIVPMLADLSGSEPTFRDFLRRIKDMVLEAQRYADLPLDQLTHDIWPHLDRRQHALFPVMFSFLNKKIEAEIPGLRLAPLEIPEAETSMPFDLQLRLWSGAPDITGNIEYSTDIFSDETMSRLVRHYHVLVDGIVKDPDRRLSDLPLLTEQEFQQYRLTGRADSLPLQQNTLPHRIALIVQKWPNALAVCDIHEKLTFQQLEQRALRLAYALHKHGVEPEQVVVLKVERTVELVVGLLGVLKAGAVCVLCEPPGVSPYLSTHQKNSLLLTRQQIANWTASDDSDLPSFHSDPVIREQQLACIIPGSTAQDDTLLLSHRALLAVLDTYRIHCEVKSSDRCLHYAPLDLPIALIELLLPLLSGATLYLATRMDWKLAELISDLRISVAALPAPLLTKQSFAQQTTLRSLIVTGELRPIHPVVQERYANALVYAIGKHGRSFWPLPAHTVQHGHVALRASGATFQALVLSDQMAPVPHGVVGTLYLAGEIVPEDSENHSRRTAVNSSAYSWSSPSESQVYCTGLSARTLTGGVIEYLGDPEAQLTLNGRRIWFIELAQILRAVPGVCDAVVVTVPSRTATEQQLVAYVKLDDGVTRTQILPGLKQHLLHTLPAALRPIAMVVVPTLPLTTEGMIRYSALPAPQQADELNYFVMSQQRNQLSSPKREILAKWLSREGKSENKPSTTKGDGS